jgi:tRNA nucleotidyltransferase/poly(A) polymerase
MTAENIIKRLQYNGFEAYLVGGCVRDMILNVPHVDMDISTSATPDEIINIFTDCNVNIFGKSFAVTVVDGIEVATFRKDRYDYTVFDDKSANVTCVLSAEEDAIRRDFTINSLFLDTSDNKILDFTGGVNDLNNRIIRFNGDPLDRISEDPNRIIRACRFLAKIDGSFDDNTFKALRDNSQYVRDYVKPERIRLEILKAMKIKKASVFFRALYDIGVLKYIFPSMDKTYLCPGGPYHIEDVFDHCMMAGDHCSTKYPIIKLAAYLHDVGKAISMRINPGTNDIWFEGHDTTGAEAVRTELYNLRFDTEEVNIISGLISLHMRVSNERRSPKGVRRTLVALSNLGIPYQSLVRLAICDKMGGLKSRKHYNICEIRELSKAFRDIVNSKGSVCKYSDLSINGNDVMSVLNIKPSKQVGEIIKKLFDMVIDNPELNDRDTLLKLMLNN